MSGYILQPTASASGHVINWTALPGVVVGYQDFRGAVISLASLSRSGGQQLLPSFPASAAESVSRLPELACASDQDSMSGYLAQGHPGIQQVVASRRLHGARPGGSKMKWKSLSIGEDVNTDAEAGEEMLGSRSVHYCHICRVTFNAPSQAQQHYAGRHHARRVRICSRKNLKYDEHNSSSASSTSSSSSPLFSSAASAAAVTMESTSLQLKHSREEINTSTKRLKHSTITWGTGNGSTIDASVYCRLCSVAFNSDKQALQHYAGKTHSKRLRADNVIYAYKRNETRKPAISSSSSSSSTSAAAAAAAAAAARETAGVFECFVCGLRLKSQRLLDRHQRRHRQMLSLVFSGLGFDSRFPVLSGL